MINRGVIFGPDILAAGRILCITGGHGAGMGYEINGPVEALSATRTLIKKGGRPDQDSCYIWSVR